MSKVFIGITLYNHEHYILDCLRSIVSQTYKDFRLVIADDVSKDKSREVVKKFITEHPDYNIELIEHPQNIGIAKNVNSLIDQIKDEEFVSLFSGDDIMQIDRLEFLTKALTENSKASFAFSDMEWFRSFTGKKITNHFSFLNKPATTLQEIICENPIPSPTLMFRASMMKGVRYDERLKYINDHMFIIELMTRGEAIFINKPLVRYRKHRTSASISQSYLEDRIIFQQIIKDRFSSTYPSEVDMYQKLVNYSHCLELQIKGKKLSSVKYIFKTFPDCILSLKWITRLAYMVKGLTPFKF